VGLVLEEVLAVAEEAAVEGEAMEDWVVQKDVVVAMVRWRKGWWRRPAGGSNKGC